ncbi:MAG: uroporphyrinogen-III synthase [Acidobacteriota bacterium]|nr:uroporphyrinogen-III synthase [Acidobacteriota bacterium]
MSFAGARVLSFESRRATEMAELIRINGGDAFVAPSLVEIPLERNEQVFEFAERLYAGEFDMAVFLTGVGTRLMGKVLTTRDPEERFLEALRKLAVVARGPKPSAVLREWKVPVSVSVPEPNTWRELLSSVESRPEKSVAVQEYGRANLELVEGLKAQGRTVTSVPVYQWALPTDTAPLEQALQDLLASNCNAVLFTTGVQIDHFLEFASQRNQRESAIEALRRTFVASIGPDCTEALRSYGLNPNFEPSHSKMGILVREAAETYSNRSPQ